MGEFVQNNWFWILLVGLFIWMHTSGMGCGGHGKHGHGDGDEEKKGEGGARHQH